MDKNAFGNALKWLGDAPLFIDEDQVDRFYDSVAFPASRVGASTVEMGEEQLTKLAAEITAAIAGGTPVIDVLKAKLSTKFGAELGQSISKTTSVVFEPIRTPQRQLLALTWYYQDKLPARAFYVIDPKATDWRDPKARF